MFATLVLVVSLSLHSYHSPYKSRTANLLEVILHLNFLALLLLELTPIVREELFVFSVNTYNTACSNVFSHVSYIVFLLAPIYYAPILLLLIVAITYLVIYIKRYS